MRPRPSNVRLRVSALCSLITFLLITDYCCAIELDPFLEKHCYDCHDSETHKGGLDLTTLQKDFANPDTFARWVKVHDQMASGEMPPKKKPRPPAEELKQITTWLDQSLIAAERARLEAD